MSRPKSNTVERELTEGKNWICEVYPESCNIDEILERLNWYWSEGVEYWYIKHDKDRYTEDQVEEYKLRNQGQEPTWSPGDLKKEHYHIVVHNSSNCILRNAARKFGVESNLVQKVGNLKKVVRYLIHKDNLDKYQYSPDEVITNNVEKFESFIKDEMQSIDKARILLEYIYSTEKCSISMISQFAINNNCWDELRRGQHIYTQLINERNRKYEN